MGEAEDSLIKASNLPLNIKQTSEPRSLRSHQKLPRPPGSDFAPRLLCTPVPGRPRAPHSSRWSRGRSRPAGSPRLRPPGAGTGSGRSHGGGESCVGTRRRDPKERGEPGKQQPPDTHPWVPASVPFVTHWARPGQSTCGDGSPGCAPRTERAAGRQIKAKRIPQYRNSPCAPPAPRVPFSRGARKGLCQLTGS